MPFSRSWFSPNCASRDNKIAANTSQSRAAAHRRNRLAFSVGRLILQHSLLFEIQRALASECDSVATSPFRPVRRSVPSVPGVRTRPTSIAAAGAGLHGDCAGNFPRERGERSAKNSRLHQTSNTGATTTLGGNRAHASHSRYTRRLTGARWFVRYVGCTYGAGVVAK